MILDQYKSARPRETDVQYSNLNQSIMTPALGAFLGLLLLADDAAANCKMHDAKWKRNVAPTISQPSRTDPTRIMVNWASAIDNARFVGIEVKIEGMTIDPFV